MRHKTVFILRVIYIVIAIGLSTFAAYRVFFTASDQLSRIESVGLEFYFLAALFSIYLYVFQWKYLPDEWNEFAVIALSPFVLLVSSGERVISLGDQLAVLGAQLLIIPLAFTIFLVFGQFFSKTTKTNRVSDKIIKTILMLLIYGFIGVIIGIASYALFNYYIWESSINSLADWSSLLFILANVIIVARHYKLDYLLS